MNDISDVNMFSDKALMENIGHFIQQNRIRQNRTQEELAKDAAISRSTLSLVEKGANISLNTLIKILRILDVLYVLKDFSVFEEISPIQLAKGEIKRRQRATGRNNHHSEADLGW